MSDITAADELSTLLDLMQGSYEDTPSLRTPELLSKHSRQYALLNAWSKRTGLEQEKILHKLKFYLGEIHTPGVLLWMAQQALRYPTVSWLSGPKNYSFFVERMTTNDHFMFYDEFETVLKLRALIPNRDSDEAIIFSLPIWAYTDGRTQQHVVDLFAEAFRSLPTNNDRQLADLFSNTPLAEFEKIADKVAEATLLDIQRFVTVYKLYTLLENHNRNTNSWKKQQSLLNELDEGVASSTMISQAVQKMFHDSPQNMSAWLNYSLKKWGVEEADKIASWMVQPLQSHLIGGNADLELWQKIAGLPNASAHFSQVVHNLIVQSPSISAKNMQAVVAQLKVLMNNSTVGPVLKNTSLQKFDIASFFVVCEEKSNTSHYNAHFKDKELLKQYSSAAFNQFLKILQSMHPSVGGAFQAARAAIGGDSPETDIVVVPAVTKRSATSGNFSQSWDRWNVLAQNSKLKKAVQRNSTHKPEKARRKM